MDTSTQTTTPAQCAEMIGKGDRLLRPFRCLRDATDGAYCAAHAQWTTTANGTPKRRTR